MQTLRKNDELCRELDAGRVFAGFTDCIDWEKVRILPIDDSKINYFELNNCSKLKCRTHNYFDFNLILIRFNSI